MEGGFVDKLIYLARFLRGSAAMGFEHYEGNVGTLNPSNIFGEVAYPCGALHLYAGELAMRHERISSLLRELEDDKCLADPDTYDEVVEKSIGIFNRYAKEIEERVRDNTELRYVAVAIMLVVYGADKNKKNYDEFLDELVADLKKSSKPRGFVILWRYGFMNSTWR